MRAAVRSATEQVSLCNRNAISSLTQDNEGDAIMGRSILLWLIGIPIPIIILLAIFWR